VLTSLQIIDFAIWLLFSKSNVGHGRVQHLLCQGYKRDATSRFVGQEGNVVSNIPGVVLEHPNSHVILMKAWPWPQVLAMLGNQGEKIMIDLVLDTGIFLAISGGMGTYHQLSGE
jgi:telomerase reverse transcriptase